MTRFKYLIIPFLGFFASILIWLSVVNLSSDTQNRFAGHLWNKNHIFPSNSFKTPGLDYDLYFPKGYTKSDELGLQMTLNKYIKNLKWKSYEKNSSHFLSVSEGKVNDIFNSSIKDPSSITHFGGCGFMNAASNEVSYNFFHKYSQRLVGVGRAGSTALSYLVRLATIPTEELKRSNIVIDLFPDQFKPNPGLHPFVFLDYVSNRFMSKILFENKSPEIHDFLRLYLKRESENITNPSYTLRYYLYNLQTDKLKAFLFEYLPAKFVDMRLKLINFFKTQQKHSTREKVPNWENLIDKKVSEYSKISSSNRFSLLDKIFIEEFRSKEVVYDTKYFVGNKNLRDGWDELITLLNYLRKHDVKPLFVIYGIHSHFYKNLGPSRKVQQDILQELDKRGFEYLNLWEKTYQKGLISDGVRHGPYGWLRVNKAISEYFNGDNYFENP